MEYVCVVLFLGRQYIWNTYTYFTIIYFTHFAIIHSQLIIWFYLIIIFEIFYFNYPQSDIV